jgi:hypothetical protein
MFDFEIGQQVVCVGDWGPWARWAPPHITFPVRSAVYTVRSIFMGHDWRGVELLSLRFEEIRNPALDTEKDGHIEPGFDHVAFRPCRKTSIEQFTELLVTPPKKLEPV